MAGFGNKLNAFQLKAVERIDQVRRASIVELFSLVIDATPVDDGFLKGGWQTSMSGGLGRGPDRKDPTGALAKAQVLQNLGDLTSVVHFVNAMPYAYRIEFDGWSAQAPRGMVRVNVSKWSAIVAAKAKAFSD